MRDPRPLVAILAFQLLCLLLLAVDRGRGAALAATVVLTLAGIAVALSQQHDAPRPTPPQHRPVPGAEPETGGAEQHERARAAELALARRQATYALMTNLARRNQSLVGRQLSTLDDLERDERDPDVLAGLFALDHLATRMRRNAENLLVLAGASSGGRSFGGPIPVEDLLRGAAAEVEQYARVDVTVGSAAAVAGHAVSDVAHLLAELLDNALACSPPDTQVTVGAVGGDGLRLWVADEGIGMSEARLAEHNALLSAAADEPEVGATLGFPVVRRLAARHGIHVTLGSREGGEPGLVAYVDLPAVLVTDAAASTRHGARPASGDAAVITIPGRRAARRMIEEAQQHRRNAPSAEPRVEPLAGELTPTVALDLGALRAGLDATDVPSAARITGPLTRRIPLQALREAGGEIAAPQGFEPAPYAVSAVRAAPSIPVSSPDPQRSQQVFASYRAGMARARGAAADETPIHRSNEEDEA